jgi:hypothetical protein
VKKGKRSGSEMETEMDSFEKWFWFKLPSFSVISRGLLVVKSLFFKKNGLNKGVRLHRGARLHKGSRKKNSLKFNKRLLFLLYNFGMKYNFSIEDNVSWKFFTVSSNTHHDCEPTFFRSRCHNANV